MGLSDTVFKAVGKALELSNKEYGGPLQDGDSISAVFNDCVIGISLKNGKLSVDVQMGKPIVINESVFPEEADHE